MTPSECPRCGEDVVSGQCVQCLDNVFCAYCDVEVASETCDGCDREVCGEHSHTSAYGTPDEHTTCHGCVDADEAAADRRYDEQRDEGWRS